MEGKDFFPYPYDWRKDLEDVRGGRALYEDLPADVSLVEFIDYVRNKSPKMPDGSTPKVDILAHSRGGLVTYDALRQQASDQKVRKVLTLGTPFLGSPKAIGYLQYKEGCFPQGLPDLPETCFIDPTTVQNTVTNLPGLYELLPSRQFHAAEGSPLRVDIDENGDGAPDGEKDYDFWTGRGPYFHVEDNVSHQRNGTLMQSADEFHTQADDVSLARPYDSSVEITRVIGDSLATPDHIEKYVDYSACSFFNPTDCPTYYKYEFTKADQAEGGDETVPLHSADLHNPSRGFDLRGGIPNFYAHNVAHTVLAQHDTTLGFALSYFAEPQTAQPPPTQATASASDLFSLRTAQAQSASPEVAAGDLARLAEENGLSSTPESFAGIEIAVSGPVGGFVEDGSGNALGDAPDTPGGSVSDEIPGGNYNRIDGSQSFFLNDATGSYKAKLKVKGDEKVELKVRTYEGGKLTEQASFAVAPEAGTGLELDLAATAGVSASKLLVDKGANGVVDQELTPSSVVAGPEASESRPPTTTAATKVVLPKTTRGEGDAPPRPTEATVTLTAEDGSQGSGVADTYYQLKGDPEPRLYDAPFAVPLGTAVRFSSRDEAGNSEAPQEVLVDDAPSSRRTAEPLSSPKDRIARYVDPQGDEDWYSFGADGTSSYRVQLHGLPADYDLELYDGEGKKVDVPAERGKRSEEVRRKLPAGRYYVRVVGFEDAWSAKLPYRLKLDAEQR